MIESPRTPPSNRACPLLGPLLALLFAGACSEPGHRSTPAADASQPDSPEWTAIKAQIRKTFPTVQEISTAELARQLAAKRPETTSPAHPSGSEALVLLDARPEAEYAVSHLEGARQFEERLLAELPKDKPIVVYCSVGYRSAELAQRLLKLGYTRVRNLEGSLFEWANQGRPVYSAGGEVHKVHPYDAEWGRLLDPSYR